MISVIFGLVRFCELESISSTGENSVAPLCGLTETAVWRHCLRPKKAPFGRFDVRKGASRVLLYMKDLQM